MYKYSGTDNLEVMTFAENYNDFLIQLILDELNENDKILDFGAGIGLYTEKIAKKDYDVCALEIDLFQNKIIKDKGIKTFLNIDEIEDNSLDFVFSLNVLEHIKDDNLIIKEIKQKIKIGGKILIYVPAFNMLYSSMDKKVGHYRRYDMKSLSSLMSKNGLKIEKAFYADSLGFFITLLYKFIGNKEGEITKRSIIIYDKLIFPFSKLLDKLFSKFFGKNVYIVCSKQ